MFTNRLLGLWVVVFLFVTACAPQVTITHAPAVTPLTPTKEPTAVSAAAPPSGGTATTPVVAVA